MRDLVLPTFLDHDTAGIEIMKARDSGMPEEGAWEEFFDADCILRMLDCPGSEDGSVADLGSGYGTFTIPTARKTSGHVHAFDIEERLINRLRERAREEGLPNIKPYTHDFVEHGTGLNDGAVDHAMLFNILHLEYPRKLLAEVFRILKPGGVVSMIHWRSDIPTPRGPDPAIRPRPEDCRAWAEQVGFMFDGDRDLSECCDYHYAILMRRPDGQARERHWP